MRVATRALKALRASSSALRPRCARLTALTARARPVPWQLSTAATEVLDDGAQRRYCRIIFAGCCTQPPSHRPVWSTFESVVSDHGSFPSSQTTSWFSARATSRPRTRQPNRTALRSQARRRSDRARHVQSSRCHGGTPVRSRCVGRCAQRAHHREQQRHRRSEWAGVSWPKDDDHERNAAGGGALVRRQGMPHGPITPQTLRSVRLFARWRARPHVSASSEN